MKFIQVSQTLRVNSQMRVERCSCASTYTRTQINNTPPSYNITQLVVLYQTCTLDERMGLGTRLVLIGKMISVHFRLLSFQMDRLIKFVQLSKSIIGCVSSTYTFT